MRNHHPRGIARPHYELVLKVGFVLDFPTFFILFVHFLLLKVVLEYLGNALGDNLSKPGGAAWTKGPSIYCILTI